MVHPQEPRRVMTLQWASNATPTFLVKLSIYSFLAGWSSCGRLYEIQTGSPINNLINCIIPMIYELHNKLSNIHQYFFLSSSIKVFGANKMNEWRSSADLSCTDMVLMSKTTFVLSFHQIVVQHIHLNTKPLEPNNIVLATNISKIKISSGSSAQINYIAKNNNVNSNTVQYLWSSVLNFFVFLF